MENDPKIRDLLMTLMLFDNPDEVDILSNTEFIRYQYTLYSQLLIRYLEHKHRNRKVARQKYLFLMKLLDKLPEIRVNNRLAFSEFATYSDLPSIVIELCDLQKPSEC